MFDKAVPFFKSLGLSSWHQVKKRHVEQYAAWLDGEAYAYATEFYEVTKIKTAFNWWIAEQYLDESAKFVLKMTKPEDTDTYCYHPKEVEAMIKHCRNNHRLVWLADVIVALSHTGMRISELAGLRWSNVNTDKWTVSLRDESRSKRRNRSEAQTTKGKRGRAFPIHSELQKVIERLLTSEERGAYVFPAWRGGVLRPDNVRHQLINHVIEPLSKQFPSEAEEIGFKDGRLHSFRHYFCSVCANRGVSEQVLMTWLGHRQSKMIRRYYHLHTDESHRQMQKINFLGDKEAS